MSKSEEEIKELKVPYVFGVHVRSFRSGFIWGLLFGVMLSICVGAFIAGLK